MEVNMERAEEIARLLDCQVKNNSLSEQGDSSKSHENNLISLLSSISNNATDKLKKIYDTDEVNSGDPFFDTSADTLALTVIKSCIMAEAAKLAKPGKTEESLITESEKKTVEDEVPKDKIDSGKISPSTDFSSHQKRLSSLLKKLSESANGKMKKAVDSGELDSGDSLIDPSSPKLALALITAAFLEIGKSSFGKKTESNTNYGRSVDVTSLLESIIYEDAKVGEELPWGKGSRGVKAELDSRFGKDRPKLRGFLIRVYKHLKDPEKITIMKQVLDLYKRENSNESPPKKSNIEDGTDSKETGLGSEEKHSDKPFMKRHPIIGGMIKGLPFTILAEAGVSVAAIASAPIGIPMIAVGAIGATAISLKAHYDAGKEYGQSTTGASDKEVGSVRKWYRKHPLVGGLLFTGLGGVAYWMGQKKARKEAVEKSL
jgi:hypothetical protein